MAFGLFRLKGFCYLYTLQVGIAIIVPCGLALMTTTVVVNITHIARPSEKEPKNSLATSTVQYFMFLAFVGLGYFAYIVALSGAYKEETAPVKVAAIALLIHFFFWLVLTILSFVYSDADGWTCIQGVRCADRFFLQDNLGRKFLRNHNDSSRYVTNERPGHVFPSEEECLNYCEGGGPSSQRHLEQNGKSNTKEANAPISGNASPRRLKLLHSDNASPRRLTLLHSGNALPRRLMLLHPGSASRPSVMEDEDSESGYVASEKDLSRKSTAKAHTKATYKVVETNGKFTAIKVVVGNPHKLANKSSKAPKHFKRDVTRNENVTTTKPSRHTSTQGNGSTPSKTSADGPTGSQEPVPTSPGNETCCCRRQEEKVDTLIGTQDSVGHFIVSIFYTVFIAVFWYLYPLCVMVSYIHFLNTAPPRTSRAVSKPTIPPSPSKSAASIYE